MSLPAIPPRATTVTIERTTSGWPVYALQAGLNSIRSSFSAATWRRVDTDGIFGDNTTKALRAFQRWAKLTQDGRAGPNTQKVMAQKLDARVHALRPEVPAGLIRGMAEGEGGSKLAAIGSVKVKGGEDCGIMQYRCYGPPFDVGQMMKAFSPLSAMLAAADDWQTRAEGFYGQPGVKARKDRREFSKRLAVLAHNWPAGAADIARDGKLTNPSGAASWVHTSTRFPDGDPVRTRQEWCEFYALGGRHGEGMITRYVAGWG